MRDVLAKGSPLDLHPRTFPPGNCAQSLLAKTTVLIPLLDDDRERGPSFDLYVARSFAPYLWIWLEDAGREYGVPIATAPCRRASEGLRLICQGAASRGDQRRPSGLAPCCISSPVFRALAEGGPLN